MIVTIEDIEAIEAISDGYESCVHQNYSLDKEDKELLLTVRKFIHTLKEEWTRQNGGLQS